MRWATANLDSLRASIGFERETPPCATATSQTLAHCKAEDFQASLNDWLRHHVAEKSECIVAVGGTTSKQGLSDHGKPIHMLNVFVPDAQTVVGQWSTGQQDQRTFDFSSQAQ